MAPTLTGNQTVIRYGQGCYDPGGTMNYYVGDPAPRNSSAPPRNCQESQEGCTYTVGPAAITAGSAGFAESVRIETGPLCMWTAADTNEVSLSRHWGVGATTIELYVQENYTNAPRQSLVPIAGKWITVSQAAAPCTFILDPPRIHLFAEESGVNLLVKTPAGCTWTAIPSEPWISFPYRQSGSGDATAGYIAAANPFGPPRRATITVGSAIHELEQRSGCSYGVSVPSTQVDASGGSGEFGVTTSDARCQWALDGAPGWLTIESGTAGTGPGVVRWRAASNTEPARQAILDVAGAAMTIGQGGTAGAYTHRRFFAEGATGVVEPGFFDAYIALANPSPTDTATVLLEFQVLGGPIVTHGPLSIPALSRTTVDVADDVPVLARASFATVVRSDRPVVADRTMIWDYHRNASHAETSVENPSLRWFFAEGATHSGFELYYLLQNPNPSAAEVRVTYLLPAPRSPIVVTCTVPPSTRVNINGNTQLCPTGNPPTTPAALVNTDVSAVFEVTNGVPIIVERAMYRGDRFASGTADAGATSTHLNWFFAEGSTVALFDTFLLLANPSTTDAEFELDFLPQHAQPPLPVTFASEFDARYCLAGPPCPGQKLRVPAGSRRTIFVNDVPGQDDQVGLSARVRVTNGVGILAERAMWWPESYTKWVEGHASFGATQAGTRWAVADGEVGGDYDVATYVLVANTSESHALLTATFLFDDGAPAVTVALDPMPPGTRQTIGLAPPVVDPRYAAMFTPEMVEKGRRFSVVIDATAEVVVGRAMYSSDLGGRWFYPYWPAGTNVLGTRLQ